MLSIFNKRERFTNLEEIDHLNDDATEIITDDFDLNSFIPETNRSTLLRSLANRINISKFKDKYKYLSIIFLRLDEINDDIDEKSLHLSWKHRICWTYKFVFKNENFGIKPHVNNFTVKSVKPDFSRIEGKWYINISYNFSLPLIHVQNFSRYKQFMIVVPWFTKID